MQELYSDKHRRSCLGGNDASSLPASNYKAISQACSFKICSAGFGAQVVSKPVLRYNFPLCIEEAVKASKCRYELQTKLY
jgi:hypothetical protein